MLKGRPTAPTAASPAATSIAPHAALDPNTQTPFRLIRPMTAFHRPLTRTGSVSDSGISSSSSGIRGGGEGVGGVGGARDGAVIPRGVGGGAGSNGPASGVSPGGGTPFGRSVSVPRNTVIVTSVISPSGAAPTTTPSAAANPRVLKHYASLGTGGNRQSIPVGGGVGILRSGSVAGAAASAGAPFASGGGEGGDGRAPAVGIQALKALRRSSVPGAPAAVGESDEGPLASGGDAALLKNLVRQVSYLFSYTLRHSSICSQLTLQSATPSVTWFPTHPPVSYTLRHMVPN